MPACTPRAIAASGVGVGVGKPSKDWLKVVSDVVPGKDWLDVVPDSVVVGGSTGIVTEPVSVTDVDGSTMVVVVP